MSCQSRHRECDIGNTHTFQNSCSFALLAALPYFSVPVQLKLGVACSSSEVHLESPIFTYIYIKIKSKLIVCLGMLTLCLTVASLL